MTSTLPVSLAAPPTLVASYSLFDLIAGPTLYPWEFLFIHAHATQAYGTGHPRLRAFYTPPQAGLLNAAELPLRAFSDTYLQRFDPQSHRHLINHLQASWPENNRRCVHPSTWSWKCRDRYAWAPKRATVISSNIDATVY